MKLKEARQKLELTQPQAAVLLGVSLSMYRKYEQGIHKPRVQAVKTNYDRFMRDAAASTNTPNGDTLGRQGGRKAARLRREAGE